MTKKRPKGRKVLLIGLSSMALLAVLAVFLLPRLLVQQATQKPPEQESGTFVTRQVETTSVQNRIQQALNNPQSPTQQSQTTAGQNAPDQTGQNANQNTSMDFNQQVLAASAREQNTNPQSNTSSNNPAQPDANTQQEGSQTASDPQTTPTQAQRAPTEQNQAQTNQAVPSDGRFRVQISQDEISSMVYSGLSQGTAPEYRASIQGVATKIQGGRARITVTLLPRHLPDAFLKNLPGVTRNTPAVYLGGEMSLTKSGQSLIPQIHELSLGNFKVPMPFLQEAIKSTVQQQAEQMLRLPNGQRAVLDEVQLENGAITLIGKAQ